MVPEQFVAADVKVRRRDLHVVRVAVGRSSKIKAHQHHNLASPVLHRHLELVDALTAQVEQKLFGSIDGLEWQNDRLPGQRGASMLFVRAVLLHCDQGIRLGLCQG